MNTQNNIKWFKKDALNEFCDPTNRAHQNSERQLHSNQHLGCPNTELIRDQYSLDNEKIWAATKRRTVKSILIHD
jgi:hypothetical protein